MSHCKILNGNMYWAIDVCLEKLDILSCVLHNDMLKALTRVLLNDMLKIKHFIKIFFNFVALCLQSIMANNRR